MKKDFKIWMLFMTLSGCINAQIATNFFSESHLTLRSEDKSQKLFEASTEYSYMVLNMTNGDFVLSTDASKFITGNTRLDSVLLSKGSQPIMFKGNISENLFLFNQQINDEKLYNMPGQLTVNNSTIDCVAQFDPVNYADRTDTKNYRIDFRLSVDPSRIPITSLESKLNKQLIIEVKGGKLNIRQ